MTTLGLVDMEQRGKVALFPSFGPGRGDLMEFRRDLVKGTTALLKSGSVDYEARLVPGPDGAPDVRVIMFRPSEVKGAMPAILYVHGGGMIAGTPDMQAGMLERLASQTGALIVSVDYRLAPETPFPGGLEDVHAALVWLHDCAGALGVDPDRIMVMGDSGGGAWQLPRPFWHVTVAR
ncbi:alpha/beta hydrolase fold domain-containing protein [Komagataeibacter nataicola]|nr:alpha/beta hydrolase fold domain-containing protein [Komagataeibacter nataicola]WNM08595.1 alpha/beta hydrolase fold domain-containing protein [Komagataeibacter nataicola]